VSICDSRFKIEITNKKYRNTLIISYCIIAAIAMGIIITIIFIWFSSYTKRVISDTAVTQLDNLDNILQNNMDTYRTQLQNAYQEPNIKNYLYANETSLENEYQISRYLINLVVNNGIADYVGIYQKGADIQYYGWRYPNEAEKQLIKGSLVKTRNDMEYFIIDTGNRRHLCLFLTERLYLDGEVQRGLVYALDLNKLESQLISNESEEHIFLIFSNDGEVIIQDRLSEEALSDVWEKILNNSDSEELSLNGTKYVCNVKYSVNSGMYLVMLQNFQAEQNHMAEIRKSIYLPAVMSFIFVLFLSLILANRIYYPLDKFLLKLKSDSGLIPGDESYSKHQAEITSEKILSHIYIMSRQYNSDKVLAYLNGNTENGEEIPLTLKLENKNEQCIMLLFWTDQDVMKENLSDKLCKEMDDIFNGCKINVFSDIRNPWALLLFKEFKAVNQFKKADKVKESIKQGLLNVGTGNSVTLYSAISDVIDKEDKLQVQFNNLLICTKYNLLNQCDTIMDADCLKHKMSSDIPKKKSNEILEAVRKGNEMAACGKITELLDSLGNYEIQKVLLFLAEFCTQLKAYINDAEWTGRQKQEDYLDYYIKITSLFRRKDLEKHLKKFIINTCLENKVLKEKTLRINMIKAVEYIQEHYRNTDISVEQVADQFHISVSYFSKLFNEYVGMTFPEFINDLRLTYAKEIMTINPGITIKKITEICGFGSVSYFSNQFKKKFGVSPSAVKKTR